jgi:ribosomal protein S27AE
MITFAKRNMKLWLLSLRNFFGYQKPMMLGSRYIPYKDINGYDKCPNCGDSRSMSTKDRLYLHCNSCFYNYINYGIYGWELVEKNEVDKLKEELATLKQKVEGVMV